MRGNFTRHTRINRLAALALLVLCFVQLPARAQFNNPKTFQIISAGSDGLARGQTLRYTWANLSDPDPQQREFEPLHIRVRLLAADGSVLAQQEAAAVGAGQFQSFDFHRDQINLPPARPEPVACKSGWRQW
ncbi:MAG: hypothetical protein H0W76_14450 [Pyrinomonadaceae bacterium]|nr:hypothetical protein [Pyrinomonadaceae bacterium]